MTWGCLMGSLSIGCFSSRLFISRPLQFEGGSIDDVVDIQSFGLGFNVGKGQGFTVSELRVHCLA